jgi:cytochrome c-type protein NapB
MVCLPSGTSEGTVVTSSHVDAELHELGEETIGKRPGSKASSRSVDEMLKKHFSIFSFGVITMAVVGYFVGLTNNARYVRKAGKTSWTDVVNHSASEPSERTMTNAIAAVSYSEIPAVPFGPNATWRAEMKKLPTTEYDLFARVQLSEEEKLATAKLRASRRAYNGAPPIIPHAVENTSDAACCACHGPGVAIAGIRASVMSHKFLSNCTQCHAPPPPKPFQQLDSVVESSFVGLPAPHQGERAFQGAPPTIPHSQWMRENCNSCHGGAHGWAGIETTHPWRTNCTQCHAPSATLDQMPAPDEVPMLPPLDIPGA